MRIAFLKETGFYFVPTIIQMLLSPATTYFYTHSLTREDYGIWGLITVTTGLLIICSNWGLVNGMVRFMGEPGENLKKLLGTAYYGSLLGGLIILSLVFFNRSFLVRKILGSPNLEEVFLIGVAPVLFGLASQVSQQLLRMQKRPGLYVAFELATLLSTFTLGFYLVYHLQLGIQGVVFSTLIGQLFTSLAQFIFLRSRYSLSFSWAYLKKLLVYGAPFTLIIIGSWVLDWSDRYILKLFVPMADLGLYNLAYSYGMITQALVTPFNIAVLPYLFDFYREGSYPQKMGEMAMHYIVIYMGVVLMMTIVAKPYFLVFTPTQFHPAIRIAPLISLCYAWRGLFNIFCFCNILTGNARIQFYIELGAALLNIGLNLLFIPYWGLFGAITATLISWLWMIILAYHYNQKILPIELPKKQMLQVLGIGLVCFGGILILNLFQIWPAGIILLILYVLFVHRRVFSLSPLVILLKEKFLQNQTVSSA